MAAAARFCAIAAAQSYARESGTPTSSISAPTAPAWAAEAISAKRLDATRDEPLPLIGLSWKSERERMNPSAIAAFFNIMSKWDVREEEARALLGGVSVHQFRDIQKNPRRTLDADTLARISYLVGIFKALNVLYSKKLADAWIQRPNSNPIFGGRTPLAYMIKGGLPAMLTIRRLLDARQGGV
jgi:Protein of unknown function (DUF2384)